MATLDPITQQNALLFKEVRLRALQDAPSAFGSTYGKESQLTDDDWIQRAAQWNGEKSAAYLAIDAETPCGIIGGFIDRDDITQAHIVSMWVSPSHRRLGIGRLLVDAVIDWARTRDVCSLKLMVTSNNDPAIRFYQRLGFVQTGRTQAYPNDPALVEYEMARSISRPGNPAEPGACPERVI